MLLIFPPIAKACEPPAGITKIAGFLKGNKQQCSLWDANLEGQEYLLNKDLYPEDTWSHRAVKKLGNNLEALREQKLYRSHDRYQRAVRDINRVLSMSGKEKKLNISLVDYQDKDLSPHRSQDLLRAAEEHEQSIFFPFYRKRVPALLAMVEDGYIGLSLNYLSQALSTFALAGYLKSNFPDYTLIIGGGLITSWMRSAEWQNNFKELFTHIIEGPGELPLMHILENGSETAHQPPDFNDLPLSSYLSPGLIMPYSASSGCYWNRCSFCPEKAEGSLYSKLPDNTVLTDLAQLKNIYQPSILHFLDNAVAPSLMKSLISNPIQMAWYGFSRVIPELADDDFCNHLRKSGCVMLKLGIESGSQKVLDSMDKGINLSLAEKCLASLKKAGIGSYVYLLFGTPAEDENDACKTLDFTVRNGNNIGFLNLAVFNLPRNSPEREQLRTLDYSAGDLGLYSDFIHPKGWHRKKVRRFLSDKFRSHQAIRPILQRDPPYFTSNHAPFVWELTGLRHE